MLPGFTTRGPVVGEAEVAAFEARCGFPLPPDYRQFLLNQNGGDRPVVLEPEEDEDEGATMIVQFFSLGIGSTVKVPREQVCRDPEQWMEEWLILMKDLDERMNGCRDAGSRSYPPELLPVAEVSIGVLLLRLKGRGTGAVVYCYDPDGYEPGHVTKMAATFSELIRDLDEFQWN